jgi:hypothetical protein
MSFLFRKIPRQVIYFHIFNLRELADKDPDAWGRVEHNIPPAGGQIAKEQWDKDEQLAVVMLAPDTSVEEISQVIEKQGFKIKVTRVETEWERQYGPKWAYFGVHRS